MALPPSVSGADPWALNSHSQIHVPSEQFLKHSNGCHCCWLPQHLLLFCTTASSRDEIRSAPEPQNAKLAPICRAVVLCGARGHPDKAGMTQGEQSSSRALPAAYLHHRNKTNIFNKVCSVAFLLTSLMAKQFTHFLSPNTQIIVQAFGSRGCWKQSCPPC